MAHLIWMCARPRFIPIRDAGNFPQWMRWSTAAGGWEGQCMQPYTLLGTPFRWVCATAGDLALYIGSDKKLLDHRTSKACNLVKPGIFSLKFSRKPPVVLLYRYKKSASKSAKKIHPAIPNFSINYFVRNGFQTRIKCIDQVYFNWRDFLWNKNLKLLRKKRSTRTLTSWHFRVIRRRNEEETDRKNVIMRHQTVQFKWPVREDKKICKEDEATKMDNQNLQIILSLKNHQLEHFRSSAISHLKSQATIGEKT